MNPIPQHLEGKAKRPAAQAILQQSPFVVGGEIVVHDQVGCVAVLERGRDDVVYQLVRVETLDGVEGAGVADDVGLDGFDVGELVAMGLEVFW